MNSNFAIDQNGQIYLNRSKILPNSQILLTKKKVDSHY